MGRLDGAQRVQYMFYEVWSSRARAESNQFGPPIPMPHFDPLGFAGPLARLPEYLEVQEFSELEKVAGCLDGMKQGDHLTCEFVQGGHGEGLRVAGPMAHGRE